MERRRARPAEHVDFEAATRGNFNGTRRRKVPVGALQQLLERATRSDEDGASAWVMREAWP